MSGKRGANEGSIYKRGDGYRVAAISDKGQRKTVYGKTRGEVSEKMKTLLSAQQKGLPFTGER